MPSASHFSAQPAKLLRCSITQRVYLGEKLAPHQVFVRVLQWHAPRQSLLVTRPRQRFVSPSGMSSSCSFRGEQVFVSQLFFLSGSLKHRETQTYLRSPNENDVNRQPDTCPRHPLAHHSLSSSCRNPVGAPLRPKIFLLFRK